MKNFLSISEKDFATIRKLDMRSPHVWLATWFGCGFLRPAPGTWGSLGALPFGIALCMSGNILLLAFAILAVTYIGTRATQAFEAMTGDHDNKMIVIDEVAGQWLTMMPLLIFLDDFTNQAPIWIVAAFFLFRFFDILKPWPCGYIDKRVNTAFGVMADDLVAGLYAALILTGIFYYAGFG